MNRFIGLLALAALSACGAGHGKNDTQPSPDASAIVIRGSELSGSLLDALRGRYPAMMVDTQTGRCPFIMFRGRRSARNQSNPSVYVDGTLMVDTCILTQILSSDVDRVELFPSGISSSLGMQRNPFGVIAVYRIRR